MIENATSEDFKTRDYNCRENNGRCNYGNICRHPAAVCKVKCDDRNKVHIGNTQQHFKNWMNTLEPSGADAPNPGMVQRDLIMCSVT
jgi:hypothetical protein